MIKLVEILKKLEVARNNFPLFSYEYVETDDLNRNIDVYLDGVKYTVEWWANIGYLKRDSAVIIFDNIFFDGHWANQGKDRF